MDYITESFTNVKSNDLVIPESCISFSEMADHVAIYTHNEFANLLESIGLEEYANFESNGELALYEGTKLQDLKEKFKVKMNKVFAAIKAFWEKVLAQFAVSNKKTAAYLKKVNFDALPDKQFGKTHTYKLLGKIAFGENTKKFMGQAEKVYNGMIKHGSTDEQLSQATAKLEAAVVPSISTVSETKNAAMKRALKSKMMGEEVVVDKAWIKKNSSALIDTVTAGKSVKFIKDKYNEEKKAFVELSKQLEKLDQSVYDIGIMWATILGLAVETMHQCYACEADVYKRKFTEYRAIATKVIRAAGVIIKEDVNTTNNDQQGDAPDPEFEKAAEEAPNPIDNNSSNNQENTNESYIKQYDMINKAFNF